jgi:hypothetical protein
LQAATAQVPLEHVPIPFATAHPVLHAPQCVVVFSCCSQPLVGLPSQSPQPGLQVTTLHVPDAHDPVPFAIVQTFPHAPQLLLLVSRSVSQPSLSAPAAMLQLPQFGSHVAT